MIHFIGVGGIGMSALAGYLLAKGFAVSGSDIQENENIKKLVASGLIFYKGHCQKNISNEVEEVVYTSAVKAENPELMMATKLNIPIKKRGKLMAELVNNSELIAISGAHGKSTTSCILVHILTVLGENPSYFLGANYLNNGKNFNAGSELFVVEADESDKSFLELTPKHSVVLNVDDDHLDNYRDSKEIDEVYDSFVSLSKDKPFLAMFDLRSKNKFENCNAIKIGSNDEDYKLSDFENLKNGSHFCISYANEKHNVSSPLFGLYNAQNCCVAIAICLNLGLDIQRIVEAIKSFKGLSRRMELIGHYKEIPCYDDYAHHPNELNALTSSCNSIFNNYLFVHQPHRFSRVKSLYSDYSLSLKNAKNTVLLDIYSAGENEIEGISSEKLAEDSNVEYVKNISDINYHNFDAIIFCGAGSISKDAREWIKSS